MSRRKRRGNKNLAEQALMDGFNSRKKGLRKLDDRLRSSPQAVLRSARASLANLSGISTKTLVGKRLRAPLRLIPRTTIVPIFQGPLRGKKWIVGAGNHGCWLGSYEHHKQRQFQKAIQPGDVVYDVGANAGFYSLLASVVVGEKGHAYAFEPLPGNVLDLRKHMELNRISNCTVMEAAVSLSDGERLFDTSVDRYTAHLSASGSIHVRTVALDTLAIRNEIRPPDFMKIDIEGAEYDCLQGCIEIIHTFRPVIYLAAHGQDIHDACLRFLAERNYEVESLDERPAASSDELIAQPRSHAE
jgi:FkbM family methyltransferase